MQLTDNERFARKIALASAIQNDPGASADVIVSDADQFRRFLMGEPQMDAAESDEPKEV
ncbi:hypothetical protein KDW74_gp44 [Mycobacterium phage Antsirabe]|uniref:Uncharacterized protein n=1 Tax=Mycobacterium phage Antsirabe TaxID=2575610 RepID=A0A5J6THW7_9CAUD|nr:hypothetical protein KDW74_gp44 [Mycobacterium phage Antsirabe]QFG09998.1 hypothetical protein PBI_ANTSIRABE_44 [Mycobacterium phage Antsirabe]